MAGGVRRRLILAARQHGFLHATPETWEETRAEFLARMDRPSGLPDLGPEAYLIEAFFEAGPTAWTAMGEQPLGWPEAHAYASATGWVAEAWELRVLIDMSRGYLGARQKGQKPNARPPVEVEVEEV